MSGKCYSRMAAIAAFLHILNSSPVWSQNIYPASGDALIHGLTIGTGRGNNQISNTALGDSALIYTKAGIDNTAVGWQALFHNSSGQDNTALGYQALYTNFSGGYSLAAGRMALFNNYSGNYNIALGDMALYGNSSGSYNTAVGGSALTNNTTGLGNTACGDGALYDNTTGSYSAALGCNALSSNTTGSYNTASDDGDIAYMTNSPLSNAAGMGFRAVISASNSVVFSNYTASTIGGYAGWTTFSDGRFKKNINRNVPGLAFINQLDPITYTLDVDGIEARLHGHKNINRTGPEGLPFRDPMSDLVMRQAMKESARTVYTGFIAQDVDKTAQSLHYYFSGVDKPKDDQQSFYGLRYSDFVVPLVKALQELSAENDSLKAANAQLSAQLDQIEQLLGIGSNAPKPFIDK
jgi:hypothetical protein